MMEVEAVEAGEQMVETSVEEGGLPLPHCNLPPAQRSAVQVQYTGRVLLDHHYNLIYLLLKGGQCKCSRVLPDHQEQCSKLFWMHLRSVRQSSFASTATTFRYFQIL